MSACKMVVIGTRQLSRIRRAATRTDGRRETGSCRRGLLQWVSGKDEILADVGGEVGSVAAGAHEQATAGEAGALKPVPAVAAVAVVLHLYGHRPEAGAPARDVQLLHQRRASRVSRVAR